MSLPPLEKKSLVSQKASPNRSSSQFPTTSSEPRESPTQSSASASIPRSTRRELDPIEGGKGRGESPSSFSTRPPKPSSNDLIDQEEAKLLAKLDELSERATKRKEQQKLSPIERSSPQPKKETTAQASSSTVSSGNTGGPSKKKKKEKSVSPSRSSKDKEKESCRGSSGGGASTTTTTTTTGTAPSIPSNLLPKDLVDHTNEFMKEPPKPKYPKGDEPPEGMDYVPTFYWEGLGAGECRLAKEPKYNGHRGVYAYHNDDCWCGMGNWPCNRDGHIWSCCGSTQRYSRCTQKIEPVKEEPKQEKKKNSGRTVEYKGKVIWDDSSSDDDW